MYKKVFLDHWIDWTIAIIVMVFIVVYGAVVQFNIEQDTDVLSTNNSSKAGQEITKDTTNWEIYTNQKYGYTIKYPLELSLFNSTSKILPNTFGSYSSLDIDEEYIKDTYNLNKPLAKIYLPPYMAVDPELSSVGWVTKMESIISGANCTQKTLGIFQGAECAMITEKTSFGTIYTSKLFFVETPQGGLTIRAEIIRFLDSGDGQLIPVTSIPVIEKFFSLTSDIISTLSFFKEQNTEQWQAYHDKMYEFHTMYPKDFKTVIDTNTENEYKVNFLSSDNKRAVISITEIGDDTLSLLEWVASGKTPIPISWQGQYEKKVVSNLIALADKNGNNVYMKVGKNLIRFENGDNGNNIILKYQFDVLVNNFAHYSKLLSSDKYELITPNGGEVWAIGTLQDITWLGDDNRFNSTKAVIEKKVGDKFIVIGLINPWAPGSIRWIVGEVSSQRNSDGYCPDGGCPPINLEDGEYYISIKSGNKTDRSDKPFSIVKNGPRPTVNIIFPKSDEESMKLGSKLKIAWEYSNISPEFILNFNIRCDDPSFEDFYVDALARDKEKEIFISKFPLGVRCNISAEGNGSYYIKLFGNRKRTFIVNN